MKWNFKIRTDYLNLEDASTIFFKEAFTSSQPRVFKPQSGLIHNLSDGNFETNTLIKSLISLTAGTLGL